MASDSSGFSTRISLILRAQQQGDQEAWNEFVDCYGPLVTKWCQKWCKQNSDVQDLSQIILIRIWEKLPRLAYNASCSFRGWLWTVSKNTFIDTWRSHKHLVVHSDVVAEELDKDAIEFANSIEQRFDLDLFHEACDRVQQIVPKQQWEIFEQIELLHDDARQVAERFGKTLAAVRMNNVRIRKLIKAKIAEIEADMNRPRS